MDVLLCVRSRMYAFLLISFFLNTNRLPCLASQTVDALEIESLLVGSSQMLADISVDNIDAEVNATLSGIDLQALQAPSIITQYLSNFKTHLFYQNTDLGFTINLSGDDVINFGADFAQCGVDWFLFKQLEKDCIEISLDKIWQNRTVLIEKLNPVIHDTTATVSNNEHMKALANYLDAEYNMPLRIQSFISSPAFLKLLTYACFNGLFTILREAILHKNADSFSFETLFEPVTDNKHMAISAYPLFKLFVNFAAVGSNFYGITALANTAFRFFGWRSSYADTLIVQACKKLLISMWFIKQLNTFYKKQVVAFIMGNRLELYKILTETAQPAGNVSTSISKQDPGKKALETLLAKAHKKAFLSWMLFKYGAFARADFFIESLLSYKGWWNVAGYAVQGIRFLTDY